MTSRSASRHCSRRASRELKPTKGDYYTSDKVWTERADFEAHSATFVKAVGQAKAKIKDVNSLKAEFPELNKVCSGCHEKFRVKG